MQVHAPNDVKTIDLGSATVLPGLIDSHTHLLIDPIAPAEAERARHYNGGFVPGYCWPSWDRQANACCWACRWPERIWRVVSPLCAILELWGRRRCWLRDAINTGRVTGPRILASADANETLGEAYLADGQKDLARQHAEKALALVDSHRLPASSWTDTEQSRRDSARREKFSSS